MGSIISPRSPDTFKTQSAVSVNAAAAVWTPASGKKFRLMGWDLACDTDGSLTFKDGSTTVYICPVQANVPVRMPLGMVGILGTYADVALNVLGPASSHITGTIFGTEEPGATTN